jgi:hypothetical protein
MTVKEFLKISKGLTPEVCTLIAALTTYKTGKELERSISTTNPSIAYSPMEFAPYLKRMEKFYSDEHIDSLDAGAADDAYKISMEITKQEIIKSEYALAYILFWKAHALAPNIRDIPNMMMLCLSKLEQANPLDMARCATTLVADMPHNEYSQALNSILSEYTQINNPNIVTCYM